VSAVSDLVEPEKKEEEQPVLLPEDLVQKVLD
jgi:hypothetical protein